LHEEAQEEGIDFEVIYVSSDYSSEQCEKYMNDKHGNWLRIKFDSTASFKQKYGVFAGAERSKFPSTKRRSGIPTLVLVDPEGKELDFLDCDNFSVIREIESKGSSFLNKWLSFKW
jgi:hypothetical protein